MKEKASITTKLALIIGVIILLNILGEKFFVRLDFTQDKRYTLSHATKNILNELDEPVTITAYFSDDLPAAIAKNQRDFKEMLLEYATLSDGMIDFEFVSPNGDEKLEQEAMQKGIQPVLIDVREKDQMKQQKAYLGAVVQKGNMTEAIPVVQMGAGMEYSLSTSIKKLSVIDKPLIGFIQGHGEPKLNTFQQAQMSLSVLYNMEPVNLSDTVDLSSYKTLIIAAPKDTIPPDHFKLLDNFIAQGGNIFVAMNRVEGDFTTISGDAVSTGLETWLKQKGIQVETNFIVDQQCASVSVSQQQMGMTFTSQVNFPYLPIISNFPEHPITEGLEAVYLQFASSITFTGDTSQLTFTPILQTSPSTGTEPVPLRFDIDRRWTEADFPLSNLTVGAAFEGTINGNSNAKIVVISDGDFSVNGEGRQAQSQQPDNISLMVNSIDWLSDDTGLIELRTKGVTSRPIDQISDGKKITLKYLNFLLPILIVLIYGLFRMQYKRNLRIKRMEEGYV